MAPAQTPSKVRSRKGGFEGRAETNLQVLSFEITEVLSFQFTVISVMEVSRHCGSLGHNQPDSMGVLTMRCPLLTERPAVILFPCVWIIQFVLNYIRWNRLPEKWPVWKNTLKNEHSWRILRSWQQEEHISKQPDWNSSKSGRGSGLSRGLWHHLAWTRDCGEEGGNETCTAKSQMSWKDPLSSTVYSPLHPPIFQ